MIPEFSVQRFKYSCNLLKVLCGKKYTDVWLNPDNCSNVNACIYKGSFIECIEFIYGFAPEVFKEYCKEFNLVVYSKDGRHVGHLDVMESLFNANVLDSEINNLLKKLFLTRGQIIHSTFWSKEEYYSKLGWMVKQIEHSDIPKLFNFIIKLCSKVNSKYRSGISNILEVKVREVNLSPSNSWR